MDAKQRLRARSEAHRRARILLALIGTDGIRRWERNDVRSAISAIADLVPGLASEPTMPVNTSALNANAERYRLVLEEGLELCHHELGVV